MPIFSNVINDFFGIATTFIQINNKTQAIQNIMPQKNVIKIAQVLPISCSPLPYNI